MINKDLLPTTIIKRRRLRKIAYESLLELATDEGINASGKEDVYGCIFGRDSAITIIKTLNAIQKKRDGQLNQICRRALLKLISLQGQEVNIESGEEPGKFLHEYRREDQGIERLLNLEKRPDRPWNNPWYLYPDNTIRNYDSLDSTPLILIAIYKYYQVNKKYDKEFLISVLPAVEMGLNWIITYGDRDKDFLLEYVLPPERQHGGLMVQSWTDSLASIIKKTGELPLFPIAPVEVQGHAWMALKVWASFYKDHSPSFAQKLESQAKELKKQFNKLFIFKSKGKFFAAQALDGAKNPIKTVTGNPLLLLWTAYTKGEKTESVLNERYINDFVQRGFMGDLFDADAGIRTMSTTSPTFNPNQDSYHNGSFWPVLNGMVYEGLLNFGFQKEAKLLKEASLKPLDHFGSPIELYVKGPQGEYLIYQEPDGGQSVCRVQAWSAASMLDMVTEDISLLKVIRPLIRISTFPFKLSFK